MGKREIIKQVFVLSVIIFYILKFEDFSFSFWKPRLFVRWLIVLLSLLCLWDFPHTPLIHVTLGKPLNRSRYAVIILRKILDCFICCFPFHTMVWCDWLIVCVMLLWELWKKKQQHQKNKPQHTVVLLYNETSLSLESLEISNYLLCLGGVTWGEGWSSVGVIHFALWFEERQVGTGYQELIWREAGRSLCWESWLTSMPISYAYCKCSAGERLWPPAWLYSSAELSSSFSKFKYHVFTQ